VAPPLVTPLDHRRDPLDAAAAWPADRPLLLLHSGRRHPRHARWSILAAPRATYASDGSSWRDQGVDVDALDRGADPVGDLARLLIRDRAADDDGAPFEGGWIVALGYELGAVIEPAARHHGRRPASIGWPMVQLAHCPDALVHDHATGRWHAVGRPSLAPLERSPSPEPWELEPPTPGLARDSHERRVARTVEYIAAGDIFQANITQPFRTRFGGARGLAIAALRRARPWYGGYLEWPGGRAILSLSPELFLEVDPRTRRVVTRPIKGTRPSHADPAELLASEKDAAELNMIVDLMRNDLGRVSEFGSVEVTARRHLEVHPTVHHGVAEVAARLRPDVSVTDLLRATFPAGSVTGAPKIRAMQIIEELEPVQRGPYCGSLGFIDAGGRASLNVAIRTLRLEGGARAGCAGLAEGTAVYGVGGGIVADSVPAAEYEECLDKARILGLIGRGGDAATAPASTQALRRR
jgi:para-aminobenzoate synthetase component 1